MRERYLDTKKSVIISSPAGSGKTEKLARRYTALLKEGAEVEKILAVTFTEKAAAEMKERIIRIVSEEDPELMVEIRGKIPLMRIMTIHAFCLRLLKRFSIELGIDPSLDVLDEIEARELWEAAVYGELMAERDSPSLFFQKIKQGGLKGWAPLKNVLDFLYGKRPETDLALEKGVEGAEEKAVSEIYKKCLERYENKKRELRRLDFADFETLAYKALSFSPEWHNILWSFDEHTDHILVDEFQDTSRIQWKIIDKLTEEWRSGAGAKRELGKTPTIFLVGDDKQSIYLFRGADVGVFHEAKERLSEWLGKEYVFEEARENYRSLPRIVEFANRLFENIMPPDLTSHAPGPAETWRTRYSRFEAVRAGEGHVELMLVEGGQNMKDDRTKEAEGLALNIKALAGVFEIKDGDIARPCKYSDMAVLLNKRTHLSAFECALRGQGIPFIVLKGIGFYDEPEAAVLREFVSFTVDPEDDYALFCLLRSPVFGAGYPALSELLSKEGGLFENIAASANDTLRRASEILNGLLERMPLMPLSELIERMLEETGGWSRFGNNQRLANVKKFIGMIEAYESKGLSPVEIRERLIRGRHVSEIPKANVNPEGITAVKIMTVHAAKGLQFPMVFLPSLDDAETPKSGPVLADEKHGLRYEPDSAKRSKRKEFVVQREKEIEEGKRLFYVAVTRAMDFLSMTAVIRGKPKGRLAYLDDAFGVLSREGAAAAPFHVLSPEDISNRLEKSSSSGIRLQDGRVFMEGPSYTEPIVFEPVPKWRDVTEDTDIMRKHGEDWIVLGRVIHGLLEALSKGIIRPEDVERRAEILLKGEAVPLCAPLMEVISKDMKKLLSDPAFRDIILPSENSFSELPFNLRAGKSVFKGRIDRVLVRGGRALIYDYKTYPVKKAELPRLAEKYRFQMDIYARAASELLSLDSDPFIVFTHLPEMVGM